MRVLASFLVAVPFVAQGATVTFNQQIAPIQGLGFRLAGQVFLPTTGAATHGNPARC